MKNNSFHFFPSFGHVLHLNYFGSILLLQVPFALEGKGNMLIPNSVAFARKDLVTHTKKKVLKLPKSEFRTK